MDCQKISQLEESYLLGELEEGQMRELRLHLKQCLACRQRVGNQSELLGRLFSAITPVVPPAYVRDSLLAQAKAQRPAPIGVSPYAPSRRPAVPVWPGFSLKVYAGVVSGLLIGAVFWLSLMQTQVQDLKSHQAADTELLALTSAPDSIIWVLQQPGQKIKPGVPIAKMYVAPRANFYYVTASHLAAAPAGQVYRMWYSKNDVIAFGGDLQPNSKGEALLEISDPQRSGTQIDHCFITLETRSSATTAPLNPPFLEWKTEQV